ncbi:DUF4132 domain-containing protein [Actinomadura sp. BRA 177]|uniref:DUF4132 domain-containing protein n=1 Tax=Actinomadura sp. BRA 177 TaxID=2745202 RepID=UPI00159552C6|nr:DUF4132 domain-containing protein [Actinomadura sp. BRA 177]NVI90400.1 DUF4132 domain-containing protein [Actinomadura sp. BRA 177]
MEDHLPDEGALAIPDAWRRTLHPRRGGVPGPRIKLDASAPATVRALIEETGARIESLIESRYGDPALSEAARRYLNGADDPAGAGAVAAVTAPSGNAEERDRTHRAFVDAWTAGHGLPFTACALVELAAMRQRRAGTVRYRGRDDLGGMVLETARRVRSLLAAADDTDYAEAERRLEAHRTSPMARWVVSYLVPTRHDWVDECTTARLDHALRTLRFLAVGTAAHLGTPPPGLYYGEASRALLATLLDGIGADALPFLLHNIDDSYIDSRSAKMLFEAVAVLPSDDAFRAILDRLDRRHARAALHDAMARFPVRALRLLARAGADDLLKEHVQVHAEVVAAVLPGLPDDVRAVVEPLAAASVRVPDAPPEMLPGFLAAPPWGGEARPLVPGLAPPRTRTIRWLDGERDEWLNNPVAGIPEPDATDWVALAETCRDGGDWRAEARLMVHGPEDVVRPLLADWSSSGWRAWSWMRIVIARYELDALPLALRLAADEPASRCDLLLPYLDAGVAALMGEWSTRRDKVAATARAWLDRHGLDAVPFLVPAALGARGKGRRAAESALRHLSLRHDPDAMVAAAPEAADGLRALLAAHPAQTGLLKRPKIGDWLNPAALPQVLLRGREHALPPEATRTLAELLALRTPHGMAEIEGACDSGSLAGWGWAVFGRWRDAGAPARDGWALAQLGRTGDDATVRRLAPVIRAWPGTGGHSKAVAGLDVLAEIGTEVALMTLHGIALRVKFTGLRAAAEERLHQVAAGLGLSTEQLADRLVPSFGLEADGSLTLDYGPRRFTIGFDEQLKPYVADETGKRRKTLPKPGAKDDPDLAPAAYQRFTGLKKDVRTAASDQLRRLERAMVAERRWTAAEFRRHLAGHPLVRHIARRLVWVAEDGDKAATFRIAEDGTFADAADDAFTLAGSARVGIAHPLHLDVGAWSEVFADYEILQPFPQLGRPVHALTGEERESGRLARFEGLKVPFGKVLGLVRLGWERGEPQDAGGERWISRRVAAGRYVVIDLDPGISVGAVDASGDHQTLRYVWLATEPDDYRPRTGTPLTFGELDDVIASEILADLETLAEAAN